MLTRLISSYQKVTKCRRQKIEHLSTYVSRFRSLAAIYLLYSHASSTSQFGELLAITLLNNACLEECTLTNTKIHLISLAEGRALEDNKSLAETIMVLKEKLAQVSTIVEKFKALDQPSPNILDPAYQDTLLSFYEEGLGGIQALGSSVKEVALQAGNETDPSVAK